MDLRYTFDQDVTNYDEARPAYPDELFTDLFRYVGSQKEKRALEIGPGTGKATVPILNAGYSVTGVELGENLFWYLKEHFRSFSSFSVLRGDFLSLSPALGPFDLIYSATAFHWIPKETGYPLLKALLRDGGTVALFWNHPFPNRIEDPTNRVSKEVYQKYRPSGREIREFSQHDTIKIRNLLKEYGFQNIQWKLYHKIRTLTSSQYLKLIRTYSDHRALPTKIQTAFEEEMKTRLDEIGGIIRIYDTVDLYLATK